MKDTTWFATLSAGSMIVLSACAPEPTPQVIYAEPVFNKFGNPSCRPGDVPISGAYTADLPLCSVIGGELKEIPEELEAIKHSTRLKIAGWSLREIAEWLTDHEHQPRGVRWYAKTVRSILLQHE